MGGLVSALRSTLQQSGGLWLGWSGRDSERGAPSVPNVSTVGGITVAALDLPTGDVNLFYNVFSNRTMWPLLHGFPAKMSVRHDSYRTYRRVSRKYAETLMPMLHDDDLVWIHDYHLMPLGHELRSLGWRGKTGYFLHTPFPPAEVFALLPWARGLLDTLLDYDLIGLQTRRYERNLLDSLTDELKGAVIGNVFTDGERFTTVKPYPIGIDAEGISRLARQASETAAGRVLRSVSPAHHIVLGVDRLDYTKGIVQRLRAYEHLLRHYPSVRGQISMIQISAPSRSRVPEYVEEKRQLDQIVGQINVTPWFLRGRMGARPLPLQVI